MDKYTIILPCEIEGQTHLYGSTVELDLETAVAYAHCLRKIEKKEEVTHGGNSQELPTA